jgi:Tol biopolymer transport system component/imidazolonepropionase-like amidohydrolase
MTEPPRRRPRSVRPLSLSAAVLLVAAGAAFAVRTGAGADDPAPPLDINAAPKDARMVEFTTDEGTWMSVDVAPDGRTLLFDLLGDIYRLPIGGGRAERVTSGPAFDYAPRHAPDGRTVVFCSDRGGNMNLWLMDADGKNPRALTSEKTAVLSSPSWTPDGLYVLARKEETTQGGIPPVELWMFHRDGGAGVKVIPRDKLHTASGPVASPDGRYIYLSGRQARFDYTPDMENGLWHVMRFDRRTGETLQLTTAPGGGLRPTLAPDGRRLIYARRDDARTTLVLRDLDGGAERVLKTDVSRDEQEGFAQMDTLPGASFTPDGRVFVFWSGGRIHRIDLDGGREAVIPFSADVSLALRPLHRVEVPVGGPDLRVRVLRWPALSPDGRRLTFEALGKIWTADVRDGKAGAPRRLTRGTAREYAPEPSPDGRFLAYVSWTDRDLGHVWKIPAGGGTPVRLTRRAGHYVNPAWSPEGKRIVFVAGSGAELRGQQPEFDPYYEIRWVPADPAGGEGSEPRLVTAVQPVNALRYHPIATFGPEGERVFFQEAVPPPGPYESGKTDLVSVRLDGTDKQKHLRFGQAEDAVVSPDGAWVAYAAWDDVHVAALPRAGADPVEVAAEGGAVPVFRLSREGGGYVGWADGGRAIVWGMGNTVYRQSLEAVREHARARARYEKEKTEAEAAKGAGAAKAGEAAKPEAAAPREPEEPKPAAIAVDLVVPKPRPKGSVVLRNARAITMRGDEILERADIVVTGNRIAAIGPAGSVAAPAGAASYDLAGKTVIPGLVDVHAHLHYSAFEIFPETKWEYIANLAYGVTTTHDPSAHSIDVFAEGEQVEAGEMTGPRIYSTGDVLYGGVGYAGYTKVESAEDAKRATKRMKAYGAHWLKVYQQPRREQRIWFAEAARAEGVGVTMEGAGELHTDLTNFFDGFTGMEHSLPVALYKDVVTVAAKSGTAYTPTLLVSYGGPTAEYYFYQNANPHDDARLRRFTPHEMLDRLGRRRIWYPEDEFHFPTVARGAAAVARQGGRVCLGAHGQLQGLGAHWEMWAFTVGEGAMTPMEALRTATWSGAEALGFGKDLGSLEAGKLADLVVIDGDPLRDIRQSTRVVYTMKDGVLYDADNMNAVWPEARPLPPFFWRR